MVQRVKNLPAMRKFNSVAQLCPTLCDPMDRSMPGLPAHHQLPEFTQTHAHWVGNAEGSGLIPRLGRPPGEGNGNSLLGEPMDRSLAGYSPWGNKESVMTGQACMQLYEVSKVVRFTKSESRMVVSRGWREGERRSSLLVTEFQFCKMKTF